MRHRTQINRTGDMLRRLAEELDQAARDEVSDAEFAVEQKERLEEHAAERRNVESIAHSLRLIEQHLEAMRHHSTAFPPGSIRK